jgi:hypothetical protein
LNRGRLDISYLNELASVKSGAHSKQRHRDVPRRVALGRQESLKIVRVFGQRSFGVFREPAAEVVLGQLRIDYQLAQNLFAGGLVRRQLDPAKPAVAE